VLIESALRHFSAGADLDAMLAAAGDTGRTGWPLLEVLDAFDMAGCAADRWDVVFIGQSAHHFTAGQLAKMIAQSRRIATTAFVAVDGQRSLKLLAFVPLSAAFTLERGLVHDGAITARKFFAESELAEIAAMAAPDATVTVAHHRPGYSVLTAAWG
jgi:hypothetical protein